MTDLVQRLRAYNPPDRTADEQRQIAQDIHEAADEIERLRRENAWQLTEIKELPRLRAEIERLTRENICDACAGTGTPISCKPCMCGGTGRMSDAAIYLRKELFALRERIARGTRVQIYENVREGHSVHWAGRPPRAGWVLIIDDEARDGKI